MDKGERPLGISEQCPAGVFLPASGCANAGWKARSPGCSEVPLFILADETQVWRDRRFVRWWDVICVFGCAMSTWGITILISIVLLSVLYAGRDLLDPGPLNPWIVAVMVGVFYGAAYLLAFVPINTWVERQVTKHRLPESVSGLDDPYQQDTEQIRCRRHIAEMFLRSAIRRSGDLGEAVREYDALHAEEGLLEQRASLLIEEGRVRRWRTTRLLPTLDEMVIRAIIEPMPGEVEPVALPIRVRVGALAGTVCLIYVLGPFNNELLSVMATGVGFASVSSIPSIVDSEMARLGMGFVAMFILGYFGLREQGLFPLALWRGECSAEKTRVFHRFRWKTFRPGRDLAILRFTSNQEADIAFLGADGSHATARVGGKYLDHFIACWASPAHAGCRGVSPG